MSLTSILLSGVTLRPAQRVEERPVGATLPARTVIAVILQIMNVHYLCYFMYTIIYPRTATLSPTTSIDFSDLPDQTFSLFLWHHSFFPVE